MEEDNDWIVVKDERVCKWQCALDEELVRKEVIDRYQADYLYAEQLEKYLDACPLDKNESVLQKARKNLEDRKAAVIRFDELCEKYGERNNECSMEQFQHHLTEFEKKKKGA